MNNLFFLKIEIIVFFISLFYFSYYIIDRLLINYLKIKKIIKPGKNKKIKKIKASKLKKVKESSNPKKATTTKKYKKSTEKKLSDEEKQEIFEIVKKVHLLLTKGHNDSARGLIIKGLAIDKHNRELNLNLAQIYEKEEKYKNAEYIYRDLLVNLKNDYNIRKSFAFNLALQNNFEESLKNYEAIYKTKSFDEEIIDMLSDLTYDMKKYKKCIKYTNLYLIEKPRNVEKMFMKAICLESFKKNDEAILLYKKILQIQPYNNDAKNKIIELNG